MQIKHLMFLVAFLVTWKTYEGAKVTGAIRFTGDKSSIGNCICQQIDHSEQFKEDEEWKAVQFAADLSDNQMIRDVKVWRMELK